MDDQNIINPIINNIQNLSEGIINSNIEEPLYESTNPNNRNMYNNFIYKFSRFLEPFIIACKNNPAVQEQFENNYLKNLISDLNNLYSKPCDCLRCHILAFKSAIIDYLEHPENITTIRQNIIIPTITMLLEEYNVDTSELETSTMEEWYLQQENKPRPASEEIIKEFQNLPKLELKTHECFCGDSSDIKNIIEMPCCKKNVHLDCLLEWFKNNNTCPYCKNKYETS